MTPDRETLTLEGHEVTIHRAGSDAPLVYLHDVFGPLWDGVAERLARTHTVVLPALVGFPGSTYREDLDTMEDLAFWMMALLEQRGLVGTDVVGEGFGGWLAAEVASRWPNAFRRMVLIAPFGIRLPSAPPGALFELQPPALRKALFADESSKVALRLCPDLPETMEDFERKLVADRAAVRFAWRPYLHNPKLAARLARFHAPALVLWGTADRMLPPSYADAWKRALPGAEAALVDGGGHALAFERPEDAAEHIEAFLAREPARC